MRIFLFFPKQTPSPPAHSSCRTSITARLTTYFRVTDVRRNLDAQHDVQFVSFVSTSMSSLFLFFLWCFDKVASWRHVAATVRDCLNLVQHLQPRCLDHRLLPRQRWKKKALLKHGLFSTTCPTFWQVLKVAQCGKRTNGFSISDLQKEFLTCLKFTSWSFPR